MSTRLNFVEELRYGGSIGVRAYTAIELLKALSERAEYLMESRDIEGYDRELDLCNIYNDSNSVEVCAINIKAVIEDIKNNSSDWSEVKSLFSDDIDKILEDLNRDAEFELARNAEFMLYHIF